jgi:hypothetical protein
MIVTCRVRLNVIYYQPRERAGVAANIRRLPGRFPYVSYRFKNTRCRCLKIMIQQHPSQLRQAGRVRADSLSLRLARIASTVTRGCNGTRGPERNNGEIEESASQKGEIKL